MYSAMLSRNIPGSPYLVGVPIATIGSMFSFLLPNSISKLNRTLDEPRNIEKYTLLRVNHESHDNDIQSN